MSEQLIVGVDVDGVLADFCAGHREKLIAVTGRDLIPHGFQPSCWNYPTDEYGYTRDEDRATWQAIVGDNDFWLNLRELPGARELLEALNELRTSLEHEVYFITTRPGDTAKQQTETWVFQLSNYSYKLPTVLIARGDKGFIAHGLGLTHFIDDRPENCQSVRLTRKPEECRIFIPRRRYNEERQAALADQQIEMIDTYDPFIEAITNGVR